MQQAVSLLRLTGRSTPDNFFKVWGFSQMASFALFWAALLFMPANVWKLVAACIGLFGPQLWAIAAAVRRAHDAGFWALLLVVPAPLFLPAALTFVLCITTAVAPNHPWWYLHALVGGLGTAVVSLMLIVVLGGLRSRPAPNSYGPPPEAPA